jgi:hypothetical protein
MLLRGQDVLWLEKFMAGINDPTPCSHGAQRLAR